MTLSGEIIIQQEVCSKSYMEPTMSAMQRTSTFCFENKKDSLAICLLLNPLIIFSLEMRKKSETSHFPLLYL